MQDKTKVSAYKLVLAIIFSVTFLLAFQSAQAAEQKAWTIDTDGDVTFIDSFEEYNGGFYFVGNSLNPNSGSFPACGLGGTSSNLNPQSFLGQNVFDDGGLGTDPVGPVDFTAAGTYYLVFTDSSPFNTVIYYYSLTYNGTTAVADTAPSQMGSHISDFNVTGYPAQSVTFTVDTTAPTSQQGFTNTATAVKARFFESNTVYADTLKHFEELLCKLAYDLLEQVARKSENDVIVQAIGSDKFKWIKPAVFDEAPIRYAIRVEIGSSSFDSIEQRREESLALMTVLERAAAAGANVDFDRAVQDIIEGGFEGKDSGKYIKQDMDQLMGMLGGAPQEPGMPQGLPTPGDMPEPVPSLSEPNALTQAVVGGDLTGLE